MQAGRGVGGGGEYDCPVCHETGCRDFFQLDSVPVFCNVLHATREDALGAARGSITLAFCSGCGMVFNRDFDPGLVEYAPGYENSLFFSPRFARYATDLAAELVERLDLRDRSLVEIGAGDGRFLELLCTTGGNRGVGYDPSRDEVSKRGPVEIRPEAFDAREAARPWDLILSRHVLEHIHGPREFLESLRRGIGARDGVLLFFEVPNGLWTIQRRGVWDVIYEHCSYFTAPSLRRLFRESGFEPGRVDVRFGGQFLTIESRPSVRSRGRSDEVEIRGLADLVLDFEKRFGDHVSRWSTRLAEARSRGRRVVLWGAGSKGVTFLNGVGGDATSVDSVVDVNPGKHGRFTPGTGHEVVSPEELRERQPDLIVVMNPLYREEIEGSLRDLGVTAEVTGV